MELIALLAYLVTGVIAGLLAGLLGISGGVITVPALIFIFHLLHFPEGYITHMAIGTSLAAMVISALSSTWAHHKNGFVLWELVRTMLPGIIVGSAIGALIAHVLSGVILEMIFGVFAILIGLLFWRKPKESKIPHYFPTPFLLNMVGSGIGALSSLLGIGGGIITVPCLTAFQIPEKKAIGTSAATGVFICALGALFYLYFGYGQAPDTEAIGYINVPAFLAISVSTAILAPIGARLTRTLEVKLLRKLFAAALVAIGLSMLLI